MSNKKIAVNVKRAALVLAAAAIVGVGAPVRAARPDDEKRDATHKEANADIRTVKGKLGHVRNTNIRIMNSDKYYRALYLDTDGDMFEDYIAYQIVSESEPQINYAPGCYLKIVEARDSTGHWVVSDVLVAKGRRMRHLEKSR